MGGAPPGASGQNEPEGQGAGRSTDSSRDRDDDEINSQDVIVENAETEAVPPLNAETAR